MDALLEKQSFAGLDSCTWLYSGAETPPLNGAIAAMNEYLTHRTMGPEGREENARIEQSCKDRLARLLRGSPEQIAFMANSSDAISMLAHSIKLAPGDNVVINTLEFPSGVLPWLMLKERGIEVRVVEHRNWVVSNEEVLAKVDGRTKLVVASHVSYLSGARIDYRSLYRELTRTNALLLLDATQSLGAVEVDMNDADIVVCSSYKWLLGVHGLGILAVNPARTAHLYPQSIGWRSVTDIFGPNRFESYTFFDDARRFETGYPSYPSLYAMNFSINLLLEVGIERIERHILTLGQELIDRVTELGYEVITPADPRKRAGNVSFVAEDGERIANGLSKRGVYAWGGDGRLRASIHLFNDSGDIDRFASALEEESGCDVR